ncbi:MAG: hypothetical protein IH909_01530 [Proteobacteria bacterium]|nr:hypothetical protein [Pseudomonadota bacterium]
MGKWLAEFQENTLETPINSTDNTDRSSKTPDLSVLSVPRQGVLEEKSIETEFLESAKQHKPDLLLFAIVSEACEGLTITPQQFTALLTEEDKHLIIKGKFEGHTLRAYAKSFNNGINTGRIVFHPTTELLIKHGVN